MNINWRPKSVFRQKSSEQLSRFEIFSVTLRRHLLSEHRPWRYDSPIQSWASSLFKRRPQFPPVSEIDVILICKKLTKNQIGPPAFPNGGRGSLLFLKLTSLRFAKNSWRINSGLQPFQTEAAVPFCLWNWLYFDRQKKSRKIRSGLQPFQTEAEVYQFFVVSILPPQSFCSIWRSGINVDLKLNESYRLPRTMYLVIKTELFGT